MRIKKPKFHFALQKQQEKAINSTVAVFFVVGILVLLNMLGSRLFGRLDLTRDQTFTLSKASRELVGNLEDNLIARAYFTEDLPAPYNDYRKYLQDKLAEYKVYGKGKFSFEFVDLSSTENQEQAQSYGIQPIQFNVMQSDEYRVKNGYMGVAFISGDKTPEVIPAISSTTTLEYDISSTIKKLTRPETLSVAFLQEDGATLEMADNFQTAFASLYKLYDVSLVTSTTIPSDLSVLIVAGVTSTLSDYTLYQIDQAIMRGTKVMFLPDAITMDLNGFAATAVTSGLDGLLSSYGVNVTHDLVADLQAQRISVSSRQGYYTVSNVVDYPLIPVVTDFSDNPVTASLQQLSLPFVSSLKVPDGLNGREKTVLAESSDKSWSQTSLTNTNPTQQFVQGTTRGPFALAVALQGSFTSYYQGKTTPAAPSEAVATSIQAPAAQLDSIADNRLIVVGTSKIIQDSYLMDEANMTFFVNCVDYLTQDEDLIAIRSKGMTNAPLKDLGNSSKNLIKWGTILGIPLLVVVVAIIRFRLRRRHTELVYQEIE